MKTTLRKGVLSRNVPVRYYDFSLECPMKVRSTKLSYILKALFEVTWASCMHAKVLPGSVLSFCEPNHTVQMVLADLCDISYIYDNYIWSKLFILARIKKAKIVYFQILKLQNNKITKSTELIIKSGHFPILSKNLCLI